MEVTLMKKAFTKPIAVVLILSAIILSATSCSADKLKNFGKSFLLGQPIQNNNNDPAYQGENIDADKDRKVEVIENTNNYCIIEQQEGLSAPTAKYTVSRAYMVSKLSDAGLKYSDFSPIDEPDKWISQSGELLNSDYTFVCVDLSVEQLSDVDTTYASSDFDSKIHCMQTLYLFSKDPYKNTISEDLYSMKLYETEDITRSQADREYNYYSLVKGQTANFTFCFIVKKTDISVPDISIFIKEISIVENSTDKTVIYHIPLTIEHPDD